MAKAAKKYHVARHLATVVDRVRSASIPRSQQYEHLLRRITKDTILRALQARLDTSPEEAACFVAAQKDTVFVSLTIEANVVDNLESIALAFRLPVEHILKLALEDYLTQRGHKFNEGIEQYAPIRNISEAEI